MLQRNTRRTFNVRKKPNAKGPSYFLKASYASTEPSPQTCCASQDELASQFRLTPFITVSSLWIYVNCPTALLMRSPPSLTTGTSVIIMIQHHCRQICKGHQFCIQWLGCVQMIASYLYQFADNTASRLLNLLLIVTCSLKSSLFTYHQQKI